jgi:hypothetical protein
MDAAPQRGEVYWRFDGVDNYVEIPSSEDFSVANSGELTVSAWLRPDVLNFDSTEGTGYVHWMGKGDTGQQEWTIRIWEATLSIQSSIVNGYMLWASPDRLKLTFTRMGCPAEATPIGPHDTVAQDGLVTEYLLDRSTDRTAGPIWAAGMMADFRRWLGDASLGRGQVFASRISLRHL